MKNKLKAALVVAGLIAFAVVGSMDHADEQQQSDHYCDMVKVWEDERQRGINPYDRTGYPPKSEQQKRECLGHE